MFENYNCTQLPLQDGKWGNSLSCFPSSRSAFALASDLMALPHICLSPSSLSELGSTCRLVSLFLGLLLTASESPVAASQFMSHFSKSKSAVALSCYSQEDTGKKTFLPSYPLLTVLFIYLSNVYVSIVYISDDLFNIHSLRPQDHSGWFIDLIR